MVTIVNEILPSPPPRRVVGHPGRLHTLERGAPPRRTSILKVPPVRRKIWIPQDEILAK